MSTQPTKQASLLDQEQAGNTATAATPEAPAQEAAAPAPPPQLPAKQEKPEKPREYNDSIVASFDTERGFNLMQRGAQAFATSGIVPKAYINNAGACMIAMNMARRMGADPMMVMQNLYIVHGNPTFSAKFMVASFNGCGRYESIKYRFDVDEKTGDKTGCVAYAREKISGDIIEGPKVTLAMAKAEGWVDKPGSKWKTMPEVMLMYRAATLMIRAYAPGLSMGFSTIEEVEDTAATVTGSTPGVSSDIAPGMTVQRIKPIRLDTVSFNQALERVKDGTETAEACIERLERSLAAPLVRDQRDALEAAGK